MLVLSRKVGEVITIGNSVTITIVSYDRGIVRLGIEAPKNIPVHRKEVYDKIIELNKQSSRTQIEELKRLIGDPQLHLEKNKKDPLFGASFKIKR